MIFNDGSNFDYHFIIKELVNEFKEKFGCLEENKKNHKTFFVWIEK